MIALLRFLLVVVLAAITFEVVFAPRAKHRALDPDEPIAADGSMIAGRARTIYDTNPLLGAFGEPRPDPDDPKVFEERIEIEKHWTDTSRKPITALLQTPPDWPLCEDAAHKALLSAVRTYYDARGRQKHGFSLSGPHAKAAIEKVWSTPLDQRIDGYVRQALQSGFLHKREVLEHYLPEFAAVFADTREIGAGCPPLKARRGIVTLQDAEPH